GTARRSNQDMKTTHQDCVPCFAWFDGVRDVRVRLPGGCHRKSSGHAQGRFLLSPATALHPVGNKMLTLGKYSIGVGDRFAHQARAQLRACISAGEQGVEVIPVWNKSNREHVTVGSEPVSVRAAADAAVSDLKWTK